MYVWLYSQPFLILAANLCLALLLRIVKSGVQRVHLCVFPTVQIQDAGTPQLATLRAVVLGMFADNQAAEQRRPLLTAAGIASPPPHNILRHVRMQLRHDDFRWGRCT